MDETTSTLQPPVAPDSLTLSAQRGGEAWRRLGLRIRSITPAGLMRFFLVVGALMGLGWLVEATWVWLVPFAVGGVIAYIVLPLVNWLNRFLPRWAAVLLSMGLALGVVFLFFALLVPALVQQFYRVYLNLPGVEEMRVYLHQLDQYITTLPAPTQTMVNNAYAQAVQKVQANMSVYLNELVNLALATLLSTVNTISFLLGFLMVPSWLLMILKDHRKGIQATNQLLPAWLAPDFWGIWRIFNRTFNAFVRGQMVLALVVAVLTYFGLALLVWYFGVQGENVLRYELLLAMVAGLMQLIPTIGPFLGAIPALLVGLQVSNEFAIGVIVLYIAVQLITSYFVAPQVERRIIDIHPAILLIVVVALSVFGFWWILLAAPVTAIVRDLYLYIYGRFNGRPAGLMPGETLPLPEASQSAEAASRIPLAYRHSRAAR